MDPASVAGIAIASISLSVQVLSGIFQAYSIFDECRGMPEDTQYISTCFLIERERLRDWASSVGLDDYTDDESVSLSLRNSRLPLLAILTEIRSSIIGFLRINGGYDEMKKRDWNQGHGVITIDGRALANVLGFLEAPNELPSAKLGFRGKGEKLGHDMKQVTSHPKRLKWVLFDKAKVKELLSKLHELNGYLRKLLDEHQIKVLQETMQNTSIELVQMHNTVFGLKQLVEAAIFFQGPRRIFDDDARTLVGGHQSPATEDVIGTSLLDLAKFKELNLTTVRLAANLTPNDIKDINSMQDSERVGRTMATYNSPIGSGFSVWIEWKKFKVAMNDGKPESDPEMLPRIEELALLLTSPKPKELAVPPCLGFFKEKDEGIDTGYFGFVFIAPPMLSGDTRVLSLSSAIAGGNEPSLCDRFAMATKLATSMLYLHSVNWLHKGLRSENVVWFIEGENVPYSNPYTLGFEYSRPSRSGEMTEEVPFELEWEPYRHPDIRGIGPHPLYRKTFDIFSLGIVLLEIALWERINTICPPVPDDARAADENENDEDGEDDAESDDSNDPNTDKQDALQQQLSDNKSDLSLKICSRVGNKFFEAIRTCIGGRTSFGIPNDNEETDIQTSIMLQQQFKSLVVEPLRGVAI